MFEPYVDKDWINAAPFVGSSRGADTPSDYQGRELINDLPGICYNYYSWDGELPFYFTCVSGF